MSILPGQYDSNNTNLKASMSTIKTDYSFVHFAPNARDIHLTDINSCYASPENSNSPAVSMVNINTVLDGNSYLHTNDSCKLNAGILQSKNKFAEQAKIKNLPKTPGLVFNVYDGYYANNAKYFLNKTPSDTGTSIKFLNISNSVNSVINNANYVSYSVEWTGFFMPSQNGNWTFSLSSDNSSLLWLGDIAINEYTADNAFVNNANLHPMATVTNTTGLLKGRLYPIRVQYGNLAAGNEFTLKITAPDGSDGSGLLYTVRNDDGTIFEKELMYYSLVEQNAAYTSNGLFQCFVTKPNDIATKTQLKRDTQSYRYETVWSFLNENTESSKFSSTNYFCIDADNYMSMFKSDGIVLKSLSDANGKPIISDGNIRLEDTGILSVFSTTDNSYHPVSVNANTNSPGVNDNWKKYADAQDPKITNTLTVTSDMLINNSSEPFVLISLNGFYKLEITSSGNLIIKQSITACGNVKSDSHYTSSTANRNDYYLYRVDADEKMNNFFMSNNSKHSLLPVQYDNPAIISKNTYSNTYVGYYPESSDLASSTVMNGASDCSDKCNADPNCKYYYNYTSTDNTKHCLIKNDSKLPKQFIPNQPNSNISSSTLYVRDYGLNLPANDPRSKIPSVDTDNYVAYADYELMVDKSFEKTDPQNIGYKGLDTVFQNQLIKNYNYLKGNGQSISENFDNHGYKPGNDVHAKGANPGAGVNLPSLIQSKQINPLIEISNDYSNLLGRIDSKYRDIDANIKNITNDENAGIRDQILADPKQIYDYSGDKLQYNSKKPTKIDALHDDLNVLILQENQLYILGTITIASLFIGAIYFGKGDTA